MALMLSDGEILAREAYHAYGQVTDFKNFQGNLMPEWEALPETIQQAWIAASARAVEFTSNFKLAFDDREKVAVEHALNYANEYSAAGIPGHGQFMLIAKLAKALGIGR